MRAWRDAFPEAVIVGADLDPDSVSASSEIAFEVDQTKQSSLVEFVNKVESYAPFDLIVDDGFHEIHANVKTLMNLFPLLDSNGVYVVEDVHETHLGLWNLMKPHLPGKMSIIDMRNLRPGRRDNILILFTHDETRLLGL